MKQKTYVKSTWMRLAALVLTLLMMPSMLVLDTASAEEAPEIPNSDGITPTEATYEIPPDTAQNMDTGGIAIYNAAGERQTAIQAQSADPWTEQGVDGSDQPTLEAVSPESFAKHNSYAVSEGENLYTLTASTGMVAGSTVEYFAIRYTDADENPQTKYIFPKVHSLKATNDYVNTVMGYAKKEVSQMQASYSAGDQYLHTIILKGSVQKDFTFDGKDYKAGDAFSLMILEQDGQHDEYVAKKDSLSQFARDGYIALSSVAEDNDYNRPRSSSNSNGQTVTVENTALSARHASLKALGYSINEDTETKSPLTAWSVDEYLFQTEKPIGAITGVEVFMSKGQWTVQGLAVSKVKSIGGYGEYGYYSGKYFLALQKDCICRLRSKKSGTLTLDANGDTLINVGGSYSDYYDLIVPSESEQAASDPFRELYTFRIDIADELNAGLESLLRTQGGLISEGDFAEDLALEIEYSDKNKWTRTVTMPVLLSVIGQSVMLGDSVRTMGLAQRGDTLAFTACLPEYDHIISCKLHVGSAASSKLEQTGGIKGGNSTIAAALNSDYISISGVSVYNGTCRMSNYADGTDKITKETLPCYSYGYSFQSKNPNKYFTTAQNMGYRINAGTSTDIGFSEYYEQYPLIASQYAGNFLIRLKTPNINIAGTDGNVRVRLTYNDYSGNEHTTNYYQVKDEVMNYMGYWPSTETAESNFAYTYGMTGGNYVEFPVEIGDASSITNVEVTLDSFADGLQIDGICVSVIDKIEKRRVYGQNIQGDKGNSHYHIVRSVQHTIVPPFPISAVLYFTPGQSYSIATGTGTKIPTSEVDFNSVRYSMTYEQTQRDLGFIRPKLVYDITVKVADDPSANSINGDSGSKNRFYFQLRFKNGSSGIVLANQQLSADAFRAGHEEMFSISVNRDYSDVTEIRIIPENISDQSEVFDKLNIESITVTERTNGGAAMQYVFNDIGWIDIDYHDAAAEHALVPQAGKMLSELVNSYTVSYQRKVVNLLCEISALPWSSNYFEFEGSVAAELVYIDMNDQPQTLGFDVVSRMYDYSKRAPRAYSAETNASSADQSLYNNMGTVTDSATMLRPNHTDRFILPPLANAKTLKSITFYVTNRSHGMAEWVIGGLSISRILSDSGIVTLTQDGNRNGEYYRSMEIAPLCSMVSDDIDTKDKSVQITLPVGTREKRTINLSDSSITWSDNSSWTSAVTRLPDSTNDMLNLYIYPSSKGRNIEGTDVSAAIQYTLPFSKVMQVKQSTMYNYGSGTNEAVYYYNGIPASNMQNLSSLAITCRDADVIFSHAIIEQVRDGVIVNTYEVPLNGQTAVLGIKASPAGSTTVKDLKKQNLMLSFGENTKEMTLFGPGEDSTNINDIAVAFRYKSSMDKGTKVQEYYSPYVYLTDVGIGKISPGMMAEIPFEVPYVSEITGYRIVSFGNITADITGAMITNSSCTESVKDSETGEVIKKGEEADMKAYSCKEKFALANMVVEKPMTEGMTGEGKLNPLDLTFHVAPADSAQESGTNVPVAMVFFYKNSAGATMQMTYNDIRKYIQDDNKQFITDSNARIRLFLEDCISMQQIWIQPLDTTGMETLTIDSIHGSLQLGADPINRDISMTFDTNGGMISVRNVNLTTHIFNDSKYAGEVPQKERVKSIITEGEHLIVTQISVTAADGSRDETNGFAYKAEWIVNGTATDVTKERSSLTENGFVFIPFKNSSTQAETYKLTIWAVDNPNIQHVINVTVPVEETAAPSSPQIYIIPGMNTDGTFGTSTTAPATETISVQTQTTPVQTEPVQTAPPIPAETTPPVTEPTENIEEVTEHIEETNDEAQE